MAFVENHSVGHFYYTLQEKINIRLSEKKNIDYCIYSSGSKEKIYCKNLKENEDEKQKGQFCTIECLR